MGRVEELEAELEVVKLEEEFLKLKATPDRNEKRYRALKLKLRDARAQHRRLRAGQPAEAGDGDAVVRPDTVEGTIGVTSPGGAG